MLQNSGDAVAIDEGIALQDDPRAISVLVEIASTAKRAVAGGTFSSSCV
jgi:hypothetical protein